METELRASQTSASVQYDIAIKQLDEIRQANQLDQRAWVAVTEIKFDFSSQQSGQDPFGVVFTEIFKNTGKTPAVNVTPVVSIYDDIKRIPKSDTFPNPVYTSTL